MGNDGQFPIQITGDASSLVAASQQTNAALESNKLKLSELTPEQTAQAKALGQTGVATKETSKALEEHGQTVERTTHQHLGLRYAVMGLREQFPVLASVAHLALHPIGLVVATIAGSFALFRARVD